MNPAKEDNETMTNPKVQIARTTPSVETLAGASDAVRATRRGCPSGGPADSISLRSHAYILATTPRDSNGEFILPEWATIRTISALICGDSDATTARFLNAGVAAGTVLDNGRRGRARRFKVATVRAALAGATQ